MLGHLAELKDAERKLRIQMDTIWKQHVEIGSPMDLDLKYVERLDPVRLKVNVEDIGRKFFELQGVLKDITHTEAELGMQGNTL